MYKYKHNFKVGEVVLLDNITKVKILDIGTKGVFCLIRPVDENGEILENWGSWSTMTARLTKIK